MKATIKVKVIGDPTPPVPPFVGTRIGLRLTDSLTWGIYAATLAEGSAAVEIDWGDGTRQTCETVLELTHTYPAPGEYEVRLSDDIAVLCCSFLSGIPYDIYPPMIVSVISDAKLLSKLDMYCFDNATNLLEARLPAKMIDVGCFLNCSALKMAYFPNTVEIGAGVAPNRPFKGCTALETIHFAEANKEAIKAQYLYQVDPTLGSGYAVCEFDL